jgi:8-amino-7-oxononanoate synthase
MLRELRTLYKDRCGDLTGLESIEPFVELLRGAGAYPPFETISDGVNEPLCTIDGRSYLLFCANNYLNLSEHPAVKQAAKAAIDKYGTGPGGSRVISGNIDVIEQLETAIAELTGTEDCLTFPTGYMANVTVFQALLDPLFLGMPCARASGALFLDECNHGSVVDGSALTTATVTTFRHNDFADLEAKLTDCERPNRLVVTEGVYSLEGEIADIPAYIDVARRNRAWLMVDDAHGIGVIGEHGGGIGEHHRCAADIDLLMGCMDKAMGATGGYLCGRGAIIDYLRIAARSSILSSAIQCGTAGGVLEAIRIIRADRGRREAVFAKAAYLRTALRERGFTILGTDDIPSLPLLIGDEYTGVAFAEQLFRRGILCSLVRWPAVPQGKSRFRIIVMAEHSHAQLDRLAAACEEIGRELGVISKRRRRVTWRALNGAAKLAEE